MRSQDRSVDPKKKIREEFEWVFHFLDSLNAKYTGAFFRLGSCAKTAKSGSQAARFFAAKSRYQKSGSQAARFIGVKQRKQDARPQEYTKIAREAQKRRKKEEKKGKKKERKKKRRFF